MDLDEVCEQLRRAGREAYPLLDSLYLPLDQDALRRTRNLRLIPTESDRRGGKYAYAEWAHVVGIFQTLIGLELHGSRNNRILDVGCGTGLLGIASEPWVGEDGAYVGLDVSRRDIEFCRRHYPTDGFRFIHLDTPNPAYAPGQGRPQMPWPVEDHSFDMVTALSLWTHLDEPDARFYIREAARALRPGGKAIVTFFFLDRAYTDSLALRTRKPGRFHATPQDHWVFDQPVRGSDAWFHPRWTEVPEQAVGITPDGLDRLLEDSGLELRCAHAGNWKERPGLFFQDVLIFHKPH